jgi:hypothetical protein
MNVISRRDAIRASGFALAGPLSGALMPAAAFGKAQLDQSSTNATNQPPQTSMDFINYTVEAAGKYSAKRNSGVLDNSDHISLSQNLLLLANHLDETGFDAQIRRYAADPHNRTSVPISSGPLLAAPAEMAFKIVHKYEPTLTQENFLALRNDVYGPDEWNRGLDILATEGVSYSFRRISDSIRSSAFVSSNVSPAVYSGRVPRQTFSIHSLISDSSKFGISAPAFKDAIYSSNTKAHIVNVVAPNCHPKKPLTKDECQQYILVLGAELSFIAAWCGFTPLAPACAVALALVLLILAIMNGYC